MEALTTFVGTYITDAVLRRADGDYKGLDKYTLKELLQAAINGADRPPATDVLCWGLYSMGYMITHVTWCLLYGHFNPTSG